MLPAVDFDDQSQLDAREVGDTRRNRMLAAEANAEGAGPDCFHRRLSGSVRLRRMSRVAAITSGSVLRRGTRRLTKSARRMTVSLPPP
jgi:hypothetical protein